MMRTVIVIALLIAKINMAKIIDLNGILDINITTQGIINNNQCNINSNANSIIIPAISNCTTIQCTTIQCTTINCTTINCTTVRCNQVKCSKCNNCVYDSYNSDCKD